jgi:predicted NBD/HSP70 family sugar kinase
MAGPNGSATSQGLGQILALFRSRGPLTRSEVMDSTGLARSTINQRLDTLLAADLIVPAGESVSTGGRRPGRFAFNAQAGITLVADIGASGLRTAACDLAGAVMADRATRSDVTAGPTEVLGIVARLFEELCADVGRTPEDVKGVGISVPGPVEFATGQVVSPPIMTGWDGFDIPGFFQERYRTTVLVDNDVNAMAVGEQGICYPDVAHLAFLKVGTGVGFGIVAGGQVLRGTQGAAGDIGHIRVTVPDVVEEPDCICGNIGCVEAYAGGWALIRDLRAAGRDVQTVDEVVALIRAGDPLAARLARRAGRILGEATADAVSLLNPSVVVIGGQLAHAEEQLLAGIREVVYQRCLPLATRSLQIVRSRLDLRAGVIGLARLLTDTILAPDQLDALPAHR